MLAKNDMNTSSNQRYHLFSQTRATWRERERQQIPTIQIDVRENEMIRIIFFQSNLNSKTQIRISS